MTPQHVAALTLVLMLGLVLTRVVMLRRRGIEAFKFGKLDRRDFLIPPFALFYFFLIFSNAFDWFPVRSGQVFEPHVSAWIGALFCLAGLIVLAWSLISFGQSFRVGIDIQAPDKLITSGVFAYTRNPIYVAFASILLGQFLIFPHWLMLIYLVAGFWLFRRQILREEGFLKAHYGAEYVRYSQRVRRYL